MTLIQLDYIISLNKHRHFGKAAQACFVTQPTLSMQIQKFEEELGVVIFDRSKNPIVPTDEGAKIIEQAKIIIQESKKLRDIATESKKEVNGTLRLGVIPTLSPYIIPLFAKKFIDKYPHVKLIIEELKTEFIISHLENDDLDAALMVTPLKNNLLIEHPLYYEPFYLFVAEDHPFYNKKLINENELDINDIWLLNKGNCFRDQVLNICSKRSEIKRDNLKFESGNFETLKNMVLNASGYTILPELAVRQLSEDMKRHVRGFEAPIPIREVSLVHSRHYYKKKIIFTLIDEVKTQLSQNLKTLNEENAEIINIVQK